MPSEENIIDQGKTLDFDPTLHNLMIACLMILRKDKCSLRLEIKTNGRIIYQMNVLCFCGGMTRVWKEAKAEITDLKTNIHNLLKNTTMIKFQGKTLSTSFMGKTQCCIESFMTNQLGLISISFCS